MASFGSSLCDINIVLWEQGCQRSPELEESLAALALAPLPDGVSRATVAGFRPGPHLAPQAEVRAEGNVLAFRRPRVGAVSCDLQRGALPQA